MKKLIKRIIFFKYTMVSQLKAFETRLKQQFKHTKMLANFRGVAEYEIGV